MKKNFFKIVFFIFAFFVIINCAYAEYVPPKPVGYVNDFADVISPKNKGIMQGYIKDLQEKTGAEVTVVTLKSLEGYPIEDVGLAIGRAWGVGQKGKNNGIVVLVAPNDHKLRIEIGYGLEGIITDSMAGRIRDNYMIPYFRNNDYNKGITAGTLEIIKEVANGYNIDLGVVNPYPAQNDSSSDDFDFLCILFLFFVPLLLSFSAFVMNGFRYGWSWDYFFTGRRRGVSRLYRYNNYWFD